MGDVVQLFKTKPVEANLVEDTDGVIPTEQDVKSFLKTLRHLQSMSSTQTAKINVALDSIQMTVTHGCAPAPAGCHTQKQSHFSETVTVDMLLHQMDSSDTEEAILKEMVDSTSQAINALIP